MAIMTRMAIPIIMRIYRGQVAIEDSSKGKIKYTPSYLSTLGVEKFVIRQAL